MDPDPVGKLIKDPPDPRHCKKGYNVLSTINDAHHRYCVHFGTGTAPALLYGRPEFESRFGTPAEALYRAEAVRITRVVLE